MPSKSMRTGATRGARSGRVLSLVALRVPNDELSGAPRSEPAGRTDRPFALSMRAISSSLSGSTGDGSLLRRTARYNARVCGRSYDDMSSHAELSAKLVEARNQRYLPLPSHAAQLASAKPSVICFVSPVFTL